MGRCKDCRWWRPDYFFDWIGECGKKTGIHGEGKGACEDFEKKDAIEFCWCRDCRITFHISERSRHEGHELYCGVHIDSDAHEYTSSGD